MKNLIKLDKFYLILALVLFVLSILIIFTLQAIFAAINTANNIDSELLETDSVRINQDQLDKSVEILETNEFIPLDLR